MANYSVLRHAAPLEEAAERYGTVRRGFMRCPFSAIFSISSSFSPLEVTAGVPMRTPEVTKGLLGSLGTVFLFRVMYTWSQRF